MQVVELIERRFDLPLALGKRLDARHNRPGKTPHISSVFVAQSMDIKETGRLLSATSLASTVSLIKMIGNLSLSLSSVAFKESPIWAEQRSSTWFTVLACGFTLFTVRDLFYEYFPGLF
jgi:hypothetical protein